MSLKRVNVAIVAGEVNGDGCGLRQEYVLREVRGCQVVGDPILPSAPTYDEAWKLARAEDRRRRNEENEKFRFIAVKA